MSASRLLHIFGAEYCNIAFDFKNVKFSNGINKNLSEQFQRL